MINHVLDRLLSRQGLKGLQTSLDSDHGREPFHKIAIKMPCTQRRLADTHTKLITMWLSMDMLRRHGLFLFLKKHKASIYVLNCLVYNHSTTTHTHTEH